MQMSYYQDSPALDIEGGEDFDQSELATHRDTAMVDDVTRDDVTRDDFEQQNEPSIDHHENEPFADNRYYEYSDNDSCMSDADSNREEHRDASDEDCMKEDFDNSGPRDISTLPLGLHSLSRGLPPYPESMSPPEVAMIHSTLYSLQQQQILQLHLIQQLHQHLMQGTLPSPLPNFHLMPLANLPSLTPSSGTTTSQTQQAPIVTSIITTAGNESSTIFTTTTLTTGTTTSLSGSQVAPPRPFRSHLAELETMTNKPVSMEDEKSKSGKVADMLNRSSSGDEAYFKHRCKYCHKIFGSESALQIHIRSHTGERPFKCNICGNRFTTRGNLKVHFARHKQKYPHIQMNPNPVPEHLDKILPPPLASITSSNPPPPADMSAPPPAPKLAPSMSVPSMVPLKKEQRSPSPVEPEKPAIVPAEQNAPIPLPSSLPPFGAGYDASSFLNNRPAKYEDPFEQFMEYDKSETTKLQQLVENLEHKMSDPNECVICHRILSCKSALQMHYRTHTGERPFRCRICGRSFTTKGNLKTHMGVHRAKPPIRMMHKCPICHKEFTNSIVLQQHVRMHTPDMAGLDLATKLNAYKEFTPQYLLAPRPYAGSAPPTPMSGLDLSKSSYNFDSSKDERMKENNNSSLNSEESGSQSGPEDGDQPAAKRPRLDEDLASYNHSDSMNSYQDTSNTTGNSSLNTNNAQSMSDARDHHDQAMDCVDAQVEHRNQYSSLHDLEERVIAMSRNFPPESQPLDMSSEPNGKDLPSRSNSPVSNANSDNTDSSNCHQSHFEPRGPTPSSHSDSYRVRDQDGYPIHMDSYRNLSPGASFGALDLSSQTDRNTVCNYCTKSFACRSALEIHLRSHTKERPYECHICHRGFTTKGNMKQHMLTHKIRDMSGGEESMKEDSGKEEVRVQAPPRNEQVENNNNTSINHNSPGKFLSPPGSSGTPPTPTTPTTPLSGTSVGATTPTTSPFVRRPSNKHNCQICQKPFSSASALQIHMRTHTGQKPYKCEVCGKAFTTKGNLKVHMGTHMWNNGPSRRGRRIAMDSPIPIPTKESDFMFHRTPELYFPYSPFHAVSPKFGNEIPVIQGMNGSYPHYSSTPVSASDYMKLAGFMPQMPHDSLLKSYSSLPGDKEPTTPVRHNNNDGEADRSTSDRSNSDENRSDHSPPTTAMNGSYPHYSTPVSASDYMKLAAGFMPQMPHDSILKSYSAISGDKEPTTPVRHNNNEGETDRSTDRSNSDENQSDQSPPASGVDSVWSWKTTCHLCNKVCVSVAALEMHLQSHIMKREENTTPKPLMNEGRVV